jgi:hypothetical protein
MNYGDIKRIALTEIVGINILEAEMTEGNPLKQCYPECSLIVLWKMTYNTD